MADSASDHFEKWWETVKLGGFMNDQVMPEHIEEAFALGIAFERERCASIISQARMGERDQDLRSLIHAIRRP